MDTKILQLPENVCKAGKIKEFQTVMAILRSTQGVFLRIAHGFGCSVSYFMENNSVCSWDLLDNLLPHKNG